MVRHKNPSRGSPFIGRWIRESVFKKSGSLGLLAFLSCRPDKGAKQSIEQAAFLPILGVGLVMVPAAFILMLKGQLVAGIVMLSLYVLLNLAIEYVLKTKLMGNHIEMHTLLAFLAILGGLSTFGVMGVIYGPLIVTGFLTLTDIYLTIYDRYVRLGE